MPSESDFDRFVFYLAPSQRHTLPAQMVAMSFPTAMKRRQLENPHDQCEHYLHTGRVFMVVSQKKKNEL